MRIFEHKWKSFLKEDDSDMDWEELEAELADELDKIEMIPWDDNRSAEERKRDDEQFEKKKNEILNLSSIVIEKILMKNFSDVLEQKITPKEYKELNNETIDSLNKQIKDQYGAIFRDIFMDSIEDFFDDLYKAAKNIWPLAKKNK